MKILTLFGVTIISLLVYFYATGYRLNHSSSYPQGIYKLQYSQPQYKKGQLVLFCPPNNKIMKMAVERDYLQYGFCNGGFEPVIKKIAAIGGDEITFNNGVNINRVPVTHAKVLHFDKEKRMLQKLPDFTVPEQSYFMMSDYQPINSFDSRYYGSVPYENIKGLITPIFIF